MIIKARPSESHGEQTIVSRKAANGDMLMDFGLLRMAPGDSWSSGTSDEKALLLISGSAELSWRRESGEMVGNTRVDRNSLLEESPFVLHLPETFTASIVAGPGGAEIAVMRTDNHHSFTPRLFRPEDCRSEERGAGTMNETCTRTVRTVFDNANAPEAQLVLGEVVTYPGRWSSYPPHYHRQPEIYHYRIVPENGFGLAAIGEDAVLIRSRDTVLIRDGEVHPQAAAPGYTLWYIWVIRHLDNDRYDKPTFTPEHAWILGKGGTR